MPYWDSQGCLLYSDQANKGRKVTTSRIEMNPKVMMGKPVISGIRIPVELILRKLGEGATEADLLDAYPRLTKADIHAAIGYAADTVAHEETVLVGAPSKKRSRR